MIFFILSKDAFNEMETVIRSTKSRVWVAGGVFSENELSKLRSNVEITNFTYDIDPADHEKILDALWVIEEHHPGERIWVEMVSRT